jgi:predicted cobalt transporter CbtA
MVTAYLLNGILGLVFLIVFMFCMLDIQGALNDETGFPFLFVFKEAFGQVTVNTLSTLVLILILAGTLSYNLSSSRQIWTVGTLWCVHGDFQLTLCSSLAMEDFPTLPGLLEFTPCSKFPQMQFL